MDKQEIQDFRTQMSANTAPAGYQRKPWGDLNDIQNWPDDEVERLWNVFANFVGNSGLPELVLDKLNRKEIDGLTLMQLRAVFSELSDSQFDKLVEEIKMRGWMVNRQGKLEGV